MSVEAVVFWMLALLTVLSAAVVVLARSLIYSAFALLFTFLGVAGFYFMLGADFLAATQMLIYVGGILVLIIFAVMLTHRITDVNISNESTPGPAAFCACLCLLFALVVVVLFAARWRRDAEAVTVRTSRTDAGGKPADVDLTLLQYQADARTGLAVGGAAFEDHVVLIVKASPAPPDAAVHVEVTPVGKKNLEGPFAAPLGPDGTARIDLRKLPEDAFQLRTKLVGPSGDLTPQVRHSAKPYDFRVYRGVTEPAAYALMGPYLFAFEAISVLLLAALVGAAFLARKEVKE